ncbi:MAG TPA: PepSY domain-containing protein, partial [Pirellulaceae bacterium]|nr:PepSY domain-containing protein [Pirellulaceae bacterium]
ATVLRIVATAGYDDVTEISFDDGQWEVEAVKNDQPLEIHLHARTGKVLTEQADEAHDRLPGGALSLREIVGLLEVSGYTRIKKADFHGAQWEVEAFREGSWRELIVDSIGKVISDRLDD